MEYIAYRCDVCDRPKQDSNHWFKAIRGPGRRFSVMAWELCTETKDVMHLCGLECSVKALASSFGEAPCTSSN